MTQSQPPALASWMLRHLVPGPGKKRLKATCWKSSSGARRRDTGARSLGPSWASPTYYGWAGRWSGPPR